MRNAYIVSYDISDPKRLRAVFKTMKGFGEHIQYSVFYCDLTLKEKVLMRTALDDEIKPSEDRIIIINLGPMDSNWSSRIEFIGKRKEISERKPTII